MRTLLLLFFLPAAGSAGTLDVVPVEREPVVVEHRLDGVIEAVNQATVSAQTSGTVIELPFDVDDFVEKGEVIVRFRDTEQRARFERSKASLSEAQARFAEARAEFERVEGIYAERLVSRSEMDRAQANFEAAKARLAAAEAAMKEAREQLEQTVVRAPYSGIVVERHVRLGELAQVGAPLMSGISLEHLRAIVDVPQSLIGTVRGADRAEVVLPDGTVLAAESFRTYPYADPATHTFRVRVNLPEGDHGAWPGMLVKVGFSGESIEALTLPQHAVARRGEVQAVYVVDQNGHVSYRQVRTGRVRGDRVEILAGVSAGEMVATDVEAAVLAWKAQAAATSGE